MWASIVVIYLCLVEVISAEVLITCVGECRKVNDDIETISEHAIKLRLTIVGDKASINTIMLKYGGKQLIRVYMDKLKVVKRKGYDTRFTIHKLKEMEEGRGWTLDITLNNLTIARDNGKRFAYIADAYTEDDITGGITLKVLGGPTICGQEKFNKAYTVEENEDRNIFVTLCGNPAPNVIADIGESQTAVTQENVTDYQYKYTLLVNVGREVCGHNITLKAKNVKNTSLSLLLSSKITVLFQPGKVERIKAYFHEYHNDCMTVTWENIEAGKCGIIYQLRYNTTLKFGNSSTINVTLVAVRATKHVICNARDEDEVNVRAMVNERYGEFNSRSVAPVRASPPITTTSRATTVTDVTDYQTRRDKPEEAMQWKYILAIVVGAIALILIIAVLVIAVKRKDKGGGENNNTQMEMLRNIDGESDYAEVGSLDPKADKADKCIDENQMVYAELGPGGGRMGPKPVTEESNYAQVKTEGIFYPPLKQSPHREPPTYTVASRSKAAPPYKHPVDDYEDYDDGVVV